MVTNAVWGVLMSLTVATAAEAQGIGGLIRKKVGEVTKSKDSVVAKTDTKAEASPFGFSLTAESMASFKRGLELEIRVRDDYRNRLAKLKTPEQYDACESESATTPEAMKIMEEYGTRSEKASTAADREKVTLWLNEAFKGLILKRCGEDPKPLRDQQRDVFIKAEEAGALEFAKGWTRPPSPEEEPARDLRPMEAAPACIESEDGATASVQLYLGADCGRLLAPDRDLLFSAQGSDAKTEDKVNEYRKMKELLEKYCSLTPEQRAEAEKNGLRVPGQGTNIYWVFSRGFAVWVGPDCDHLMKLFSFVQ